MRTKNILSITAFVIYAILIILCFKLSKNYIINKDDRLYQEALSRIEQCFHGNKYLVNVEYSGQRVKTVSSSLPENYYKNEPDSKENYIYTDYFNDISRFYTIVDKYTDDTQNSGYLFTVLENRGGVIIEYTVYPKYIGSFRNHQNLSQNDMNSLITTSFNYFTNNKNSIYYNCFGTARMPGIMNVVENKYYGLINSDTGYFYPINERKKYVAGIYHSSDLHHSPSFCDWNPFGVHTWVSSYFGKVFLECNPINTYDLKFNFGYKRMSPMKADLIKIRAIGIIALTLLLLLFLWIINRNSEEVTPSEFLT